jgi:hypothetical protein
VVQTTGKRDDHMPETMLVNNGLMLSIHTAYFSMLRNSNGNLFFIFYCVNGMEKV